MNRINIKISLSFIVILVLISCNKNSLEVINNNFIVINGIITTDSLLKVSITKSLPIDYYSEVYDIQNYHLSDAKVFIYEDNNLIDTLNYKKTQLHTSDPFYIDNNFYSNKTIPKSGKKYSIRVISDNYSETEASSVIPNKVIINKVDTIRKTLANVNKWMSPIQYDFIIEFTDPEYEENFYMVDFYINNGDNIMSYEGITYTSPVIEEHIKHGNIPLGVVFSDKIINGVTHQVKISINAKSIVPWMQNSPNDDFKSKIYFNLYSINKDLYNYIRTINLFTESYSNPLSEPVWVYSNVVNGKGIFAGASLYCDSVIISGKISDYINF